MNTEIERKVKGKGETKHPSEHKKGRTKIWYRDKGQRESEDSLKGQWINSVANII